MTDERYTRVAVALHWLLALALIGQFGLGLWMEEIPKDPPGVRAYWFNLHKSIGLLIVLFVLWRMGWRVAHAVPPLNNTPAWQVKIAKLTHGLMYLLMLLIPVTGFFGVQLFAVSGEVFWHGLAPLMGASSCVQRSLVRGA
jgi:cytochrome b561